MAALTALQRLAAHPKTAKFTQTLSHADLPKGWSDDPEIVKLASDVYKEQGTNSPFFRAWFGSSKVADNAGQPLEVYHGTKARNLQEFSKDKIGKGASKGNNLYGDGFYFTPDYYSAQNFGKNVHDVYLKIENPSISGNMKPGQDGIMVNAGFHPTYVAFEPTQIKSVNNVGTFDPSNPNIYKGLLPLMAGGGAAAMALSPDSAEAAPMNALQKLASNPKTAKFVETLRHADLPTGWADDPEIVSMAGDAYRELGTNSPFFRAWHGNGLTDNAGNPQKLYHGTPTPDVTDFAFDPRRIGTNAGSSEGRGFYTVTVPDTAQGYTHGTGNVLELYSNMQKPIELHGSKSLSLPQLKKIIKSTAETEARKMAAEEGEKYTPEWIKNTWISNYTYTPDKPISASIDDVARKVKQFNNNAFDQVEEMFVGSHRFPEVSRATNSATGYDGVHSHGYIGTSKANADEVGDIYVHWFPEQLKATSNRGTFNPADPNIYRGLIPMLAGGGALAAMSPGSAQAAEATPAETAPQIGGMLGYAARGNPVQADLVAAAQNQDWGEPVTWDDVRHGLSFGSRAVLEGLGGLAEMGPNAIANAAISPFTDYRFGNPGVAAADAMNLDRPQTDAERSMYGLESGAAEAVPFVAGGGALAKGSAGAAKQFGKFLADNPRAQAILGGMLGMMMVGGE